MLVDLHSQEAASAQIIAFKGPVSILNFGKWLAIPLSSGGEATMNSWPSVVVDFRVGPWVVETRSNRLKLDTYTVRLEPKVMEVLICLALHAGEVMAREQLLREVWHDTFVTPDSLKRCVSLLRKAFTDDAGHPRIIETIPKRGYRLAAPVIFDDWRKSEAKIPLTLLFQQFLMAGRLPITVQPKATQDGDADLSTQLDG